MYLFIEVIDYLQCTYLLQSKDKLITSLREGGEGGVGSDVSAGITAEIEQEKSLLRQELHQFASTVESLRMEVQVSIVESLCKYRLVLYILYVCQCWVVSESTYRIQVSTIDLMRGWYIVFLFVTSPFINEVPICPVYFLCCKECI